MDSQERLTELERKLNLIEATVGDLQNALVECRKYYHRTSFKTADCEMEKATAHVETIRQLAQPTARL